MGVDEKILKTNRASPAHVSIPCAVAYILPRAVLREMELTKEGAQELNRTEHSRTWEQEGSTENRKGLTLGAGVKGQPGNTL